MSEAIAELNKLRNSQQNLETTKNAIVEHITALDEGQQIKDIENEIANSRKILKEKIQSEMQQIFNPLQKVKDLLHQEKTKNIDLTTLKTEMLTIQRNIRDLKKNAQIPLDTLKKEEEKLSEDIAAIENKMQEWNKPSVINSYKKKKDKYSNLKSSRLTSNTICQEAKDFMDFLILSGGHENGWAVDDHNLFLRLRSKIKDPKKLAESLHEKLPDISENQIIQHEHWLQTYIKLRDKQKEAIKNWRDEKLKQKKVGEFPSQVYQEELVKKKTLQKENKDKLIAWKTSKREQQQFQFGLHKEEERKMFLKAQEEKKKNSEKKVAIKSWKEKKEATIEAERKQQEAWQKEEMERRTAKAKSLIKEFQAQDKKFLQRKIQSQSRSNSSNTNEIFKPPTSVVGRRDPQRLYRLKKHWLVGMGSNKNEKKVKHRLNLNTMQKLRTPEWRRSLFTS